MPQTTITTGTWTEKKEIPASQLASLAQHLDNLRRSTVF